MSGASLTPPEASPILPGTYTPSYSIIRGQDWWTLVYLEDETGAPRNFTGRTVAGAVWDIDKTAKIADLGIAYPSGLTGGWLKLILTRQQTLLLKDENCFDVSIIGTDNLKLYYIQGILPSEKGLS